MLCTVGPVVVLLGILASPVIAAPELKLVHVVFSHKFYAPVETNGDNGTIFPDKLDYRHFLANTDDMVNSAKMDMYNLGVFLRGRYNDFLGDIYHPDFMRMRTSEYVLSMISGLLVDAGLWPPAESQRWSDELDWQPIPTEYVAVEKDTLLLGYTCPSFEDEELTSYKNFTPSIKAHAPLFDYITRHYGKKITTPAEVAMLYSCLQTSVDKNLSLPAWSEHLFPDGEMENVTLLAYDMLSHTPLQKTLNGGSLLKKILLDSVDHENSNGTSKLKLSMYSGEDRNVIGVLHSMGLWSPHILGAGAAILFEVYQDPLTHQYAIKMFFFAGVQYYELIPLTLKDCDDYCPLVKFASILDSVLPVDETSLCHQRRPPPSAAAGLSSVFAIPVIVVTLLLTEIR